MASSTFATERQAYGGPDAMLGIVMQLDLYAELKGHNDHVSSMEFNSSGDLLVSGAYDNQVIFWNWETKTRRLSYDPGNLKNVQQAKIMPLTNDRRIVTACGDGQVRLGEVLEDGQVHTKRLVSHRGAVHKLAVEPGNPNIIYSCGDYSFVQHFDLRSNSATKLFSCTRLIRGEPHPGTLDLYQMVFDPSNLNYFCLGGNDAYARVYDIRKCWQDRSSSLVKPVNTFRPAHLIYPHHFMITGLAYSNSSELLVSYSDELIYLFQKHMGLSPPLFQPEDMEEVDKPAQFVGHRNGNICRVNFFGPNDEYVLSGSYCGHIFIWKKNGGELVCVMTGDSLDVYDIQPHPHNPVIATCGSENNLKLWAPVANDDASPLPDDIAEIMESNRQARIDSYMPFFASENHYQRMRGQSNGDATSEER
ncbi:PREDICTED: DDB1- and CUL4-associated factor 8-like [Fragaria vesca subsp. vesca]